MSENLPNIDNLFRKALEEHEDIPSETVWSDIDKNLDKKKVVFISKKYKKLKWAAAALLIFSAGMAMYTWNTRLRNNELVKQNEMNKKKVVNNSIAEQGNNESYNDSKTLDNKAITNTNDKLPEDKPIAGKVDTSDAGGTVETAIAESKKQLKGKLQGVAGSVAKTREAKTDKDLAVTGISQNKENAISKPVNQSGKNQLNGKQSNADVTAETKNKAVYSADEKNDGLEKDATSEITKRNVEVATVREHESNLTIGQPANIEPGKSEGLVTESNEEKTGGKTTAGSKNASVKPFRGSKFSATVFYSPDFVSSRVDNDHHAFREDDRNEIKNKEKITNTSSKGILVNYNIGNSWSIQSGLVFSTITTDIMSKLIFARPDERGNINYRFNCSAGYSFVTVKSGNRPAAGDSIVALSSKNTLQYFAVPLALSYNFPVGRFTLQPGAGLAANFLTKGKIETEIAAQAGNEKSSTDRIEGLNSSYLNGSLSLSANYYLSKTVAFNFTPGARFALSAINKDAPVKTYLNSIGLAAGLTIGF